MVRQGRVTICEDHMAKQILLAEDDEDNRDLMVFVVDRGGLDAELLLAENGQEAVDIARAKKPLLILMDMQMPVMDGFTAVKILKADPETSAIPIIAFTAQARAEDKELTRSIGCVEHYTKPMDPEELIALIRRYIGE
jgi:CheY-like chemotaxis protein